MIHDHIVGHADQKKPIKDLKVDEVMEEYYIVPPQAVTSAKVLVDMWERLGRPANPFTDAGAKLMNIIIAVWEDGYPAHVREWLKDRKDYQNNEMRITDQVQQHTGRSLASYPLPVFNMMKQLFPDFNPAERKNCMKMVRKWPIFRMANRV